MYILVNSNFHPPVEVLSKITHLKALTYGEQNRTSFPVICAVAHSPQIIQSYRKPAFVPHLFMWTIFYTIFIHSPPHMCMWRLYAIASQPAWASLRIVSSASFVSFVLFSTSTLGFLVRASAARFQLGFVVGECRCAIAFFPCLLLQPKNHLNRV